MKNLGRVVVWIGLVILVLVYSLVFGIVINKITVSITPSINKSIAEVCIIGAIFYAILWINMVLCENHPKLSLFWSFVFCNRKAIKINDSRDNEEFVIFGLRKNFLYVDNNNGTEKLFGMEEYFPDVEFGDVLARSGDFLYHSGPNKERAIKPI